MVKPSQRNTLEIQCNACGCARREESNEFQELHDLAKAHINDHFDEHVSIDLFHPLTECSEVYDHVGIPSIMVHVGWREVYSSKCPFKNCSFEGLHLQMHLQFTHRHRFELLSRGFRRCELPDHRLMHRAEIASSGELYASDKTVINGFGSKQPGKHYRCWGSRKPCESSAEVSQLCNTP
ncbi:hypothetical protein K491DRAFT_63030 [Lophiostoma macrostomum CBS 122681]|uniref:Uncharacterized protein n=1 Tax=Lophiostoma macrostomum CBS 122681 TaxID=1314788 RepID=A0A6A6TNQ1_9PLEO|nr:hypothetical protein K491DRAFT_63030 [Lophiostoma macrostomum CBS 122681]